jgi:hypothetical protein
MDLREGGWGDMDWIDLAQARDQWRALVKKAVNPAASQERLYALSYNFACTFVWV